MHQSHWNCRSGAKVMMRPRILLGLASKFSQDFSPSLQLGLNELIKGRALPCLWFHWQVPRIIEYFHNNHSRLDVRYHLQASADLLKDGMAHCPWVGRHLMASASPVSSFQLGNLTRHPVVSLVLLLLAQSELLRPGTSAQADWHQNTLIIIKPPGILNSFCF